MLSLRAYLFYYVTPYLHRHYTVHFFTHFNIVGDTVPYIWVWHPGQLRIGTHAHGKHA